MKSALLYLVLSLLIAVDLCTSTGCSAGLTDGNLTFINTPDAEQLVLGQKKLLGLAGKETGTWVDSRTDADYLAGHIPGAISLPYERVNDEHRKLKDYQVLIVYGDEYNDPRANGMSKRLLALGYGDVRTLTGGMRAWKTAGNQVETGPPSPLKETSKH